MTHKFVYAAQLINDKRWCCFKERAGGAKVKWRQGWADKLIVQWGSTPSQGHRKFSGNMNEKVMNLSHDYQPCRSWSHHRHHHYRHHLILTQSVTVPHHLPEVNSSTSRLVESTSIYLGHALVFRRSRIYTSSTMNIISLKAIVLSATL